MPYIKVNKKRITVKMPVVQLQHLIELSKQSTPPPVQES